MAICLEQIFGRATELHVHVHDGEITKPWHDLQWYNEIILTSPQTTRMHEYFKRACILNSCRSLTVSCIAQLDERFTRQKVAACQLNAFLPAFLNIAVNTTTSGRQQPNRTDSFCRTVVSSRWRQTYMRWQQTAVLGGRQKIHREETWLCQKRFELLQNLSGTYPDIRLFQFCYDFCDTSSDHCDTRTILQRTKIYQKLFAVNDGWREANGLAHISV